MINKAHFKWTTRPRSRSCNGRKYDVESTVAHERGHTFGLDHQDESGANVDPQVVRGYDGGEIQLPGIFRRKFELRRPEILFETMQLRCARNRHDPWLLRQQPS